ncbi:MAG: hypothetical protein ABI203_11005 [Mucilaginibacter sp.]
MKKILIRMMLLVALFALVSTGCTPPRHMAPPPPPAAPPAP